VREKTWDGGEREKKKNNNNNTYLKYFGVWQRSCHVLCSLSQCFLKGKITANLNSYLFVTNAKDSGNCMYIFNCTLESTRNYSRGGRKIFMWKNSRKVNKHKPKIIVSKKLLNCSFME
jgi:hypothetical protein